MTKTKISPRRRGGLHRGIAVASTLALLTLALAAYSTKTTIQSGTETDSVSISADGNRVAYRRTTSTGTEIAVWDRTSSWTHVMSTGLLNVGRPRISRDGKYVGFTGQSTSGGIYIPYANRIDKATTPSPVEISPYKGGDTPPAVSDELSPTGTLHARFIWWEPKVFPATLTTPEQHYTLRAADVSDSYVAVTPSNTTYPPGCDSNPLNPCPDDQQRIPITAQADGTWLDGTDPAIKSDGTKVYFVANSTGQIRETDYGVAGANWTSWLVSSTIISTNTAGTVSNGTCATPSTSSDGRYVAFTSNASNLGGSDGGGNYDVYVRDTSGMTTTRAYTGNTQSMAIGGSDALYPEVAASGTFVAFYSGSTTIVTTAFCTSPPRGPLWIKVAAFVADWSTQAVEPLSVETASSCLGQGYFPSISTNRAQAGFHSVTPGIATGDNDSLVNVIFFDGHT